MLINKNNLFQCYFHFIQNTQDTTEKTTAQDFDFLSMVQTFKTMSYKAQEIIHKKIQDQGTQVPFFKKTKQSWRIQKPTLVRYAHSFESLCKI